MLFGGRDVLHFRLIQALLGEHRQQAHIAALDMRHGVGDVGTAHLDVPPQQSRSDFTATLKGDVTQFARVDSGGLGDQRGLHPVLAADGAAGADHHAAWVFLQGFNQVIEGLVGRVAFHRDGAIAGAHCRQPAHGAFIKTAELALGQVQQRTARPGDQRAGICRALGDDRVVGHRAHAAWHVGHTHRLGQQLLVHQRALRQFAGQVKTAARGGRGDAFRTLGFVGGQQLAGEQHAAGGEGKFTQ